MVDIKNLTLTGGNISNDADILLAMEDQNKIGWDALISGRTSNI